MTECSCAQCAFALVYYFIEYKVCYKIQNTFIDNQLFGSQLHAFHTQKKKKFDKKIDVILCVCVRSLMNRVYYHLAWHLRCHQHSKLDLHAFCVTNSPIFPLFTVCQLSFSLCTVHVQAMKKDTTTATTQKIWFSAKLINWFAKSIDASKFIYIFVNLPLHSKFNMNFVLDVAWFIRTK